jgi:hypothetical protein
MVKSDTPRSRSRFVLDQHHELLVWQDRRMKKLGFGAMKAFLALASTGRRDDRTDWLLVVAVWSSIITVGVIAVYVLQR